VIDSSGARRRRSGGGLGVGCARMPVYTHPHLFVVGVGNHIAVPCLAQLGARRGDFGSCDPRDRYLLRSSMTQGF
jgi:hypothetical protein